MGEDRSQALCDALVLLRVFASSSWRSLDIDSGGMRLSISRTPAAERVALNTPSRPTSPVAERAARLLTAPHVANLKEIAEVGAIVQAGESYATIEVLERVIELYANEDFVVISHQNEPGRLLEFGSPLVAIEPV